MRILFLDIETAPHLAYVWKLFQENVNIDRIVDAGYTLCWSAKFLGEKKMYSASYLDGVDVMLKRIHDLLDQTDVVVTYNGKKFDIPVLNKEFVLNKALPPAPYKHIDLYQVVRKNFRFASNKLDYVCQQLGLGNKVQHRGMGLWNDCMAGDKKAMKEMLTYNKGDVDLLESLYAVLLPWLKTPANYSVVKGEEVCTNCGSHEYQSRGYAYTAAGKYRRFQCTSCGTWFRSNKSEANKDKFIGV